MVIPEYSKISIPKLAQVFNNTSATYKFYWFISILEVYSKRQERQINFNELLTRMIANAWYPIHYFKLSFGLQDKLCENIIAIQQMTQIPIDEHKDVIQRKLLNTTDPLVWNLINNFSLNVPYRFLSPWIPFVSNNDLISRSQQLVDDCPYSILLTPTKSIVINEKWSDYLIDNYRLLIDYCYWNLTLYLQTKNPNVPDIANKLIKPISRNSLLTQRAYWNIVFDECKTIKCIYTGVELTKDSFDLDHFIPWSFVAHDLQWNLLPSNGGVNSSKSNKLPTIEKYIHNLTTLQKRGLEIVYRKQPNHKRLEDFLIFGCNTSELISMETSIFQSIYRKTLSPMLQIAENMGFEKWKPNE